MAGVIACLWLLSSPARAVTDQAPSEPENWALHAQATAIEQYHPPFRSAYRGPNSLDPASRGDETINLTAYAGVRMWGGGEAWADLEMDQGFGLSDTLGIAAFPNGEGSKVGKAIPYLRLQRLFFRQAFDLGGDAKPLGSQANQLAGKRTEDSLILTFGKFSPTDIFDANDYAHDPMHDFLNWAVIDAGPWDYAADAWGYSYGATAELSIPAWVFRGGLFDLSRVPNGTALTRGFGQYQLDWEVERQYKLFDEDGTVKLLSFASRGRIGEYNQAVALAALSNTIPDNALVRRPTWKSGFSVNAQQALGKTLGAFTRITVNDGSKEGEEFTDMENSFLAGVSLKGQDWNRKDDTVGIAFETGGISIAARNYFARGGLGILIGDGRLDIYDRENILEAYYSAALWSGTYGSIDYQFVAHPAFNADRGPVSIFGLRLHGEL